MGILKLFELKDGRRLSCRSIGQLAGLHAESVRKKLKKGEDPDTIIRVGNSRQVTKKTGTKCPCGCGKTVKLGYKWANGQSCRYAWLLAQKEAGKLKPDKYRECKYCHKMFPVYSGLKTTNKVFCNQSCSTKYFHKHNNHHVHKKRQTNVLSTYKKYMESHRDELCFRPSRCQNYDACWLVEKPSEECLGYK